MKSEQYELFFATIQLFVKSMRHTFRYKVAILHIPQKSLRHDKQFNQRIGIPFDPNIMKLACGTNKMDIKYE